MAQSHLSEVDAVQEFAGFASNPAPLLVAQYERIAREEMQGLPFYHATMPIVAECVLFEEQWLGCVLTPWMLSLVVLPGPPVRVTLAMTPVLTWRRRGASKVVEMSCLVFLSKASRFTRSQPYW